MPSNPLLQLMHDAVNPVTTIKSAVKLLKTGGLTEDEQKFLIDGIEKKADELNSVLDAYYTQQKTESMEKSTTKLRHHHQGLGH